VDCSTTASLCGKDFNLPIIPANMKSVIDMDLARWMSENGYFYIMHRFDRDLGDDVGLANSEDWQTISFSTGAKIKDKIQVMNLGKSPNIRVDFLTVDIAHGHSERMKGMISHIKKWLPDTKIIAGNVCTTTAVRDLYEWGADAVKVGIGQGSPCTTKYKTGFTMPMFSCVKLCSNLTGGEWEDEPHEEIPIIADGGIKHNGDMAKALAAGATMVMAGGMFAACADSPAASSTINGAFHKAYFGSASAENKGHDNNIEGKLTNIPCSDMTLGEKLAEITQDLQSSISYAGGNNLEAFKDGNVMYIEV
jgi:GMP reductase